MDRTAIAFSKIDITGEYLTIDRTASVFKKIVRTASALYLYSQENIQRWIEQQQYLKK